MPLWKKDEPSAEKTNKHTDSDDIRQAYDFKEVLGTYVHKRKLFVHIDSWLTFCI